MSPQRITVTIESSHGEDGPLTVKDGLGQILDIFDLLALAGHHLSANVAWALTSVSKNSPLTATAEAFTTEAGVGTDYAAKRIKYAVSHALASVTAGDPPPSWMSTASKEKTRLILIRNLNGIGRTNIFFEEEEAPIVIGEKNARLAIESLEQSLQVLVASASDLTHSALGSLEGELDRLTSYYGRPAVRLHVALIDKFITCVLSSDLAVTVGKRRLWQEVWAGRRVRAVGRIYYKLDGSVSILAAEDLIPLDIPDSIDREALPLLPSNSSPMEFLSELWPGDGE